MGRSSLFTLFLLAGCASADPVYIKTCPPLVTYSQTFRQAATAEIGALPPGDPLAKMISDYAALRAADRDCK